MISLKNRAVERIYLKINNVARIKCNSKHFMSTQVDDQNGGYTLSKKQRKALRKIEDDSDENLDDTLPSTMEKMKQASLMQDMEQEENNPLPWHSLLLHPSRALWRSSPIPPPAYLLDTQFNIIKASERTPKQLRRTYDRIISNHLSLSERRERERRRMVNGAGHSANSLEAKRQRGIDTSVNSVYYKPEHTVCSLKYRLVPNYAITKRILAETQSLLGKEVFEPKRILDVGIGAGSAAAAALDYFNEGEGEANTHGVEWIHGVDPSQSMRDASNILLSQVLQGQKFANRTNRKTRITFGDNLISSTEMDGTRTGGGSFDLALCAYTLHEVPSVAASLSMAAIVWEKLSPGGVAIFIEPGEFSDPLSQLQKYSLGITDF
jgi:SAM-dependent methyltransferase